MSEGRTRLRPAWHRGRSHYCGGEHQDGMNFFGRKHQAGSSTSSPGGTQRSAHKTHLNPEVSTDGLVTCELVTGAVSAENTDPGAPARVSNMMMAGEALVWMDQDHPRGTMVIGGMQGIKQGSIKKKKTSTSSATTKVYGGGTLPPVSAEEPAPTNACMTKMVQRASEKFCCAQGWEHLNSLRQTGTSRALGAGPDIWGYQAGALVPQARCVLPACAVVLTRMCVVSQAMKIRAKPTMLGTKQVLYRSTPPPALPQHSTRWHPQTHLYK